MTQAEAKQHESNMRNLAGTFAVEGLTLSPAFCRQLDALAEGEITAEELRRQLLRKYMQKK